MMHKNKATRLGGFIFIWPKTDYLTIVNLEAISLLSVCTSR
jgi:hypothetical protein